jgi:hypothetical protein
MLRAHGRRLGFLALLVAGCAAGLIATSFGSASSTRATAGGTLKVGPGATVAGGTTYGPGTFGLRASASGSPAGIGDVVLQLDRGAQNFAVCTVHGPDPSVDFTNDGDEDGNNPYPDIQCGRAYGESVTFKGCTMNAQAHGYIHSDAPATNYLGPTTLNITFKKTGATSGVLTVQAWTPVGGTLQVKGTTSGAVSMSTC